MPVRVPAVCLPGDPTPLRGVITACHRLPLPANSGPIVVPGLPPARPWFTTTDGSRVGHIAPPGPSSLVPVDPTCVGVWPVVW